LRYIFDINDDTVIKLVNVKDLALAFDDRPQWL
jgi:hypothetical protein